MSSDIQNMTDLRETVRREYHRFLSALPELLTTHPQKWVIYRDGAVQGVFQDEDSAFRAAVDRFGVRGGFVVAPIRPVEATPVTAGVMYSAP